MPIAHAGAVRAQLKQQKKLKLKVSKTVRKAYSIEEKATLLGETSQAHRRSKSIHLATMLALHAGLRDKEIRTLNGGSWILRSGSSP